MRQDRLFLVFVVVISVAQLGKAAVQVVPANTAYVATSFGFVDRVTPDGVVSTFVSGLSSPQTLTFDSSGNLYVGCNSEFIGQSTIQKITPDGAVSQYATGFTGITGLTFDNNGNLYASNETLQTVSKVSPNGTITDYTRVDGEAEGDCI